MTRSIVTKNGNDVVYTDANLAKAIVEHFKPVGRIMEPCKGSGVFTDLLPGSDWCELDEGVDFLTDTRTGYDWVVTNPPFSLFRQFLEKSMQISDNVVFLATFNHFTTKARIRLMAEYGFYFKQICFVETPPKPWPVSGFQVAVVHLSKIEGDCTVCKLIY